MKLNCCSSKVELKPGGCGGGGGVGVGGDKAINEEKFSRCGSCK